MRRVTTISNEDSMDMRLRIHKMAEQEAAKMLEVARKEERERQARKAKK